MKYPNVAGSYYPSDARRLRETVDGYLAEAEESGSPVDGRLRAIIVPHSGYLHSGRVAAQGFAALQKEIVNRRRDALEIVIIAPSHHQSFIGMVTASFHHYRTPLGDVPVSPFPTLFPAHAAIFAEEHSLEVQLPFLQRICKEIPFTVKPLLIGDTEPELLIKALGNTFRDPNSLFLITTDLSHFLPEKEATAKDLELCRAIEQLDSARIKKHAICGKIGVLALVELAKQQGLKVQCLRYDNSAESTGFNKRVVGFGSFEIYEETEGG